jgi:hypothetical protein
MRRTARRAARCHRRHCGQFQGGEAPWSSTRWRPSKAVAPLDEATPRSALLRCRNRHVSKGGESRWGHRPGFVDDYRSTFEDITSNPPSFFRCLVSNLAPHRIGPCPSGIETAVYPLNRRAALSSENATARLRYEVQGGHARLTARGAFLRNRPTARLTAPFGHGGGPRPVSGRSSSGAQSAFPARRSALVTVLSLTPRR